MPRSFRALAALLALAAASAAPLAAQDTTWYGPIAGSRIRVHVPALADDLVYGEMIAVGGDSLLMRSSSRRARMRLPLAEVREIERSNGYDRFGSAVIGGAVGAAAGAVLGAWSVPREPYDNGLERMAAFIAGGIIGAPIGAATGAILAPERWELSSTPSVTAPGSYRLVMDPGTDARIWTRRDTAARIAGQVQGVDGDTLMLVAGGRVGAYPLRDLARLEITGGRDRPRGVAWGVAIAAGGTAIFAGIDLHKGEISSSDAIGAVAGNALLGALLGYYFAPTGWERLPLPRR